ALTHSIAQLPGATTARQCDTVRAPAGRGSPGFTRKSGPATYFCMILFGSSKSPPSLCKGIERIVQPGSRVEAGDITAARDVEALIKRKEWIPFLSRLGGLPDQPGLAIALLAGVRYPPEAHRLFNNLG